MPWPQIMSLAVEHDSNGPASAAHDGDESALAELRWHWGAPRFVDFYACMYYAMMRLSEVAALTRDGCSLPDSGWGYLTFADASPAAGRAFTDDGKVHEHRGLKAATKVART